MDKYCHTSNDCTLPIIRDAKEQSALAELDTFHENLIPILRVKCLCTDNNLLNRLYVLRNKI